MLLTGRAASRCRKVPRPCSRITNARAPHSVAPTECGARARQCVVLRPCTLRYAFCLASQGKAPSSAELAGCKNGAAPSRRRCPGRRGRWSEQHRKPQLGRAPSSCFMLQHQRVEKPALTARQHVAPRARPHAKLLASESASSVDHAGCTGSDGE